MLRYTQKLLAILFCSLILFPVLAKGTEELDVYEHFYQPDKLHLSQSVWQSSMTSSYDRSGGNDDGFNGTYSIIRKEQDAKGRVYAVIAETTGQGCLSRLWMPHGRHIVNGKLTDGVLQGKRERLLIFIDGETEASINVVLQDLFDGKVAGFPKPLVGKGLGGFYSLVPVPFAKSCKIAISGEFVSFFQADFLHYTGSKQVRSYSDYEAKERAEKLRAKAQSINTHPSQPKIGALLHSQQKPSWTLNQRNGVVQNFTLSAAPENLEKLLNATLIIQFDSVQPSQIQARVKDFFAIPSSENLYSSAVSGFQQQQLYFRLPMPFKHNVHFQVTSAESFYFDLQTSIEVMDNEPTTYLYCTVHEQPNLSDRNQRVEILDLQGEGHYVGLFFKTKGQTYGDQHLPTWLEGDETFVVDGKLVKHGTGSEDYFNCGWYSVPGRLNNPAAFEFHGFPEFKMEKIGKASAYRWHLTDPVTFRKSFQFQFEHGPQNDYTASYTTVAYYYLQHK